MTRQKEGILSVSLGSANEIVRGFKMQSVWLAMCDFAPSEVGNGVYYIMICLFYFPF